jgi:HD-GYP domain-containing protein (c-di-GMP phosphodiesterase class II)
MRADKSKMFAVDMKKLKAEDGAPFPLFLFLRRNDRFVPIRLPGDPIGLAKYERFLKAEQAELWVPNTFKDIFQSYLDYLNRNGTPVATLDETIAKIKEEKNPKAEVASEEKSPEAELVKDVLEDKELSSEEKAEVLSAVSQDLMRAMNQITTRGEDARIKGMRACREVADEILTVAAQDSNIYEEILALRSSQEEIEHSVITGTMAAMFGMAIGYSNEQLLSDLIVAAIFHDVGLVRVKPEISAKQEAAWSNEERKEYEKHVAASEEILKESGAELHPRVLRMIREHHENYDGSGFPARLRGGEIDETSQIVHFANLFDRLCTGKQTGSELSPAEAFDYINEISGDPKAVQELNPELVQRVFQFMLNEQEEAKVMQEKAVAKARSVAEEI